MKAMFLLIIISLCSLFVSAHEFAQQLKAQQVVNICINLETARGVQRSQTNCK